MSFANTVRAILTMGKGVLTGLSELEAGEDPIELFGQWYAAAEKAGILMPEAMTLATASREARPSARMVLLKSFGPAGFDFFTNYGSRKANELEENPHAALCLHWPILQRQVRIEGPVTRLSQDESFAYFRTRTRGSRIGAWASRQSQPLESREALEARVADRERQFAGEDIPLPPFWGGYRLTPDAIEFWQGRANRLHDRLLYVRDGTGWAVGRLYP